MFGMLKIGAIGLENDGEVTRALKTSLTSKNMTIQLICTPPIEPRRATQLPKNPLSSLRVGTPIRGKWHGMIGMKNQEGMGSESRTVHENDLDLK